jgi:UDP-glucose 4-epimerase
MMKNQDTVIYGTGRQTRDFVYVSDVVSANLTMSEALLNNKLNHFSAWNIGTAVETSILDLHKMLAVHAQYSRQPRLEDAKAGEQLRSSLSFAQIQREWGWRPQVDLGEALGETYRSFAKV